MMEARDGEQLGDSEIKGSEPAFARQERNADARREMIQRHQRERAESIRHGQWLNT